LRGGYFSPIILVFQSVSFHNAPYSFIYIFRYTDIFVNCSWVDTRWQVAVVQYTVTHKHPVAVVQYTVTHKHPVAVVQYTVTHKHPVAVVQYTVTHKQYTE
jgi:hypothetical protein